MENQEDRITLWPPSTLTKVAGVLLLSIMIIGFAFLHFRTQFDGLAMEVLSPLDTAYVLNYRLMDKPSTEEFPLYQKKYFKRQGGDYQSV